MAISEPQASIVDSQQDYVMVDDDESESEYQTDDDSEEDPTYDIVKETCSSLSKLSIKKSKPRVCEKLVLESKGELDYDVPELDAVDQKSFENVEKIIQAGDLEKLKIDQCKVYLRKHGLRLTGTKNVLIGRIQEHLGIIDGGGEKKYPVSSFVLNCKGDACTGDMVMFEQNVYEMYNIASRSASGPPCGTRTIAGRIVKESYGAAKQQHTFTIEVLWSKGIKPLPPLHPLLIKGRNLYRLKTMRQVWTDEEDRRKILQEKHSRGSLARCNRDTRMQEKEMRKIHKGKRETRKNSSNSTKGGQDQQAQSNPIKPSFPLQQTVQLPQQPVQLVTRPPFQQHKPAALQAQQPVEFQPNHILGNSTGTKNTSFSEQWKGQTNDRFTGAGNHHSHHILPYPPRAGNHQNNNFGHYPSLKSPPRANHMHHLVGQYHRSHVLPYRNENVPPPMTTGSSTFLPKSPQRWRGPMPMRQQQQKQTCRHYVQGRCHFGDRCKFLHEN